jgi:hypothetical protein
MKYFIALLLLSGSMYCQERLTCSVIVLTKSLKRECDISGNEYSFVFSTEKNDVVFFFTNMKLKQNYEVSGVCRF